MFHQPYSNPWAASSSRLNQLFHQVTLSMPKTKLTADFQLWYKIIDARSKTAMFWRFLKGVIPLQPPSVVCVALSSFAPFPFLDHFAGAVVCDTLALLKVPTANCRACKASGSSCSKREICGGELRRAGGGIWMTCGW